MPAESPCFLKIESFAVRLSQDKKVLLKIFLLALALRVAFTILHLKVYPVTDMLGYNEAANSLLFDSEFRIKGLISANRPPLYPYFLLAVYWLFGHSFLLVRLLQAVLGAVNALLTARLGENMFDRRVGVLAGIVYALYPIAWVYSDALLTETLFTTFLLLSVLMLMKIIQRDDYRIIFAAGFFAGLAILTRTAFAPYLPFICLALALLKYKSPRIVSRFFFALLICLMTIFPWMLRNYYTHGVFTLNPKSGVDFAMYNMSSLPYIIYNQVDDREILQVLEAWKWDEVTKGERALAEAKKWIIHNPHLFLIKGVRMIMNIWGFDRDYHWFYIAGYYGRDPIWLLALLTPILGLPFVIIAPLAIAGFIFSKPFSDKTLIPALVLLCLHILTFIVYGFSRHRFPFAAFLIVWAVYAVLNWRDIKGVLRTGSAPWKKFALFFAWGFLIFSWLVEVLVDVGQLFSLRFMELG